MENNIKRNFRSNHHMKGIGFGLLLMLTGIIFLGFNFGFIPMQLKSVILSWPMLLILIGIINLFRRHIFSGTVLVLVGAFFIMPRFIAAYPLYFQGINGNFTQLYWPFLLIAAGLLFIIGRHCSPKCFLHSCHHSHHHRDFHYKYDNYYKWDTNAKGFSKDSVFSNGEHIVLDTEFKGGEMNAVFGGITLDLRHTNLPVGETILEINAVFGGIAILVPSDWYIETHLDSVFGGFKDSRDPQDPTDKTKKLVIVGSCVFGGGELKNQ